MNLKVYSTLYDPVNMSLRTYGISLYLLHLWYGVGSLNSSVEDDQDGWHELVQRGGVMRTNVVYHQVQSEQGTYGWTGSRKGTQIMRDRDCVLKCDLAYLIFLQMYKDT